MTIKRDQLAAEIYIRRAGAMRTATNDTYDAMAANSIAAADALIKALRDNEKSRNDDAMAKARARGLAPQPAPKKANKS